MTVTAIAAGDPDDRDDAHLLAQANRRRTDPDDVPRADLGEPKWLASLSPEARAKARAALERGSNVVPMPTSPGDACTCPKAGRPGQHPKCPTCQRAREEVAAEVAYQQRVFRQGAWRRNLEGTYADYADATLDGLRPEQDPDGRVSRWLDTDSRTLVLVGDNSLGKTYAGFAVCNAAVARDMWVVAWNVADLNDQLRPGGNIRAFEYAERCDHLFLDDLGAEKISEWTLEQLYRLIDARVRNRRRTGISTNLPYDRRGFADTPKEQQPVTPNMIDRYGARIVHRIMHEATVVRFHGESFRKPVPW
ncbi:ATP-binding protein [Nonomuraea bangladeshensis]|uniref:ATP-binding protein n=1 Tax=Nonomuraea bangladeshensis TaxID=404385 RepID=UPI003C303DAA